MFLKYLLEALSFCAFWIIILGVGLVAQEYIFHRHDRRKGGKR